MNFQALLKKDFKRVQADPRHRGIGTLFKALIELLEEDRLPPAGCRDYALAGNWQGYRECHIKPDLLLIYKFAEPEILRLARLGSHTELY